MKCVSCGEWEIPDKDQFEDWEVCPNCDFPYKYNAWILLLQAKINDLEKEVDKLQKQLKAVFG